MAKIAGLDALQADCLGNISSSGLFGGVDQYARTMGYLDEALTLFEASGDLAGQALTLNRRGYVIVAQGEGGYDQAERHYHHALQIAQTIGHPLQQAIALANLGVLYNCVGNYARALAVLQQSLEITELIRDPRQRGATLEYLGYTHVNLGNYATAQSLLEDAHQLLQEKGIRTWDAKALSDLGLLYYYRGEHERALANLNQALATVREYGDIREQAKVLTRMGHVLLALGQTTEATASYEIAFSNHQRMEQWTHSMEPLAGLAAVALDAAHLDQAQHYVESILTHLQTHSLDCTEEALQVYLTCFHVLNAVQDTRVHDLLKLARVHVETRTATIEAVEMRKQFWSISSHQAVRAAIQEHSSQGAEIG